MPKVTLHREKRPTRKNPRLEKFVLRWFDSKGNRRGEVIGIVGRMTRREAEAVRRAKQGGMEHGVVRIDPPKKMTLCDFIARDRDAIQLDIKATTLYEYDVAAWYVQDALGSDLKLASITREHVGRLKAYLKSSGRRRCGKPRQGMADATMRKILRIACTMFNRAVKDGLIEKNPLQGAAKGKTQSKRKRIFSPDEITAMIDVSPTQWLAVFVNVLANTGVRRNEALSLHWTDIDFKQKTLTITRKERSSFTVRGETYPVLEWETKSHEERTIPLPSSTLKALQRFRLTSGGSKYVFLSLERLRRIQQRMNAGTWRPTGELMNNLRMRFKHIQKLARQLLAERTGKQLKDIEWEIGCVHDLRRTWGTHMAQFVDCFQLCAWLGHADPKTTRDHYYQSGPEAFERARQGLEGIYNTTVPFGSKIGFEEKLG